MKRLTRQALYREAIKPLRKRSRFRFATRPYKHQIVAFFIGVCVGQFLFLLDMGLGKTKVVLDVLRYRKIEGEARRMLVLVPNVVNLDAWEEEVGIHAPDLECIALYGSSAERTEQLGYEADVYVLTYGGMMHLLCNRTKKGLKPVESRCRNFAREFDMVVYDEIHKAKSKDSLTFRLCNRLSKYIPYRYGLTGTPFGREPIDLWAEFYLIDRGKTLGPTLKFFREVFYRTDTEKIMVHGEWRTIPKRTFRKGYKRQLFRLIQNASLRYADHECRDLPRKIEIQRWVRWPRDTYEYYKQARGELPALKGKKVTRASFAKLREIASGFVYVDDEDTGKRITSDFAENPKLDALAVVLEELPLDAKALIFYEFTHSGKLIHALLNEMKLPHARLPKDGLDGIRRFKRKHACRVLAANWKSASMGGNFQIARYLIFYESPVSPIDRKQCVKRCYGRGERERMYVYDIAMKNSVDARVLEYLAEGEDLFRAVVEGKESL